MLTVNQRRTPIVRIAYLIPVIYKADVTWYLPEALAWTTAEFSTAVIALSLPALNSLVPPPKPRPSEQLDPSRHLAWLDSQVEQHFPLHSTDIPPEMDERTAHGDGRRSLELLTENHDTARDPWRVNNLETAGRRLTEETACGTGVQER